MFEFICSGFLIIISLIYTIFLLIATLLISINSIKLKKKYGIDILFIFMAIYLMNFVIDSMFFPLLPYYLLPITQTILIVIIIVKFSNLQIIGLTGGIACGKSTASKIFQEVLKLDVIDCDLLARVIVQPGRPAYEKIIKLFGKEILMENSEIDRAKLGEIIFSNKDKRRKLTNITSYYIFIEILKEFYRVFFVNKKKEVLLDAPILFETKYLEYVCYPIVLIYVTEESIQIQRMKERNGYDEEHCKQRIASQMPLAAKIKKSDVLLNNEGTIEDLKSKILKNIPSFLI